MNQQAGAMARPKHVRRLTNGAPHWRRERVRMFPRKPVSAFAWCLLIPPLAFSRESISCIACALNKSSVSLSAAHLASIFVALGGMVSTSGRVKPACLGSQG